MGCGCGGSATAGQPAPPVNNAAQAALNGVRGGTDYWTGPVQQAAADPPKPKE